jgi:alginate O-acetyltransferase complex protein AlgI
MVFNSFNYFLFLPIVFALFYFTPNKYRWGILLTASLIFYALLNQPHLLAVLGIVILVSFLGGLGIDRVQKPSQKHLLLWVGIIGNLLPLVYLKYTGFLIGNLNSILTIFTREHTLSEVNLLGSIGVSFFTFQAISYLIDVYLELIKPETHIGYFALYISFFPKLVQGPIERGEDLLPQLHAEYTYDYDAIRAGLRLFALGLFKKVIIADRLGVFSNQVFDGNVYTCSGGALFLATLCYAIQIYFDFSGYTDMALGSARLFNIKLTQNFNHPYLATSIADFWRRWHISFSRWLMDYLFKPLQMKFRSHKSIATPLALLITFIVCGFWHGARWNFIIWGALNGLYIICSLWTAPYRKKIVTTLRLNQYPKIHRYFQIGITFSLTCLGWVFFRTKFTPDALHIIKKIFLIPIHFMQHPAMPDMSRLKNIIYEEQYHGFFLNLGLTVLFISLLTLIQYEAALAKRRPFLKLNLWLFLICLILFQSGTTNKTFIYFAF